LGVSVSGIPETKIDERYPDILLQLDSYRLLIEVKIDSVQKILSDLVKAYPIANKYNAGLLLILFSSEIRKIHPVELEKVVPQLRVSRAIVLAPWMSKPIEEASLESVLKLVIETLINYKKVLKPSVDYLLIANVAREAVETLSGVLRAQILKTPKLLDQAQGIVGSFDFYKALLSEVVEKEEVMNTYIADIIAYLTILYLLFIHIISVKKYGSTILPQIIDPSNPPPDLLERIINGINAIKEDKVIKDYSFIVEPSIYILELLKSVEKVINPVIAGYIYVIQALRPENVGEELFGRIYQESIPPETRKNLGAFFTNPVAARILAYLAIEKWDDKVLDPACGSGTLLASAYEAKMEKALAQGIDRKKAHALFIGEQIIGIDIMQFAKNLSSLNLALQEIDVPTQPKIFWGDGIDKMFSTMSVEDSDDPPSQSLIYEYFVKQEQEKFLKYSLPREDLDVVIMNPPFTRRERIPVYERKKLEKMMKDIIKGKVGYWAYFFALADNVIKFGGRLAAVTPEEFFFGGSAESVRRFLLRGEIIKDRGKVKKLPRIYVPEIIIKSATEVAFSEGAHYRDYLTVFRKIRDDEVKNFNRTLVVILKRRLRELIGREKDVALQIKQLLQRPSSSFVSNDIYDAIILDNIDVFIDRHINNLKPLVFFDSIKILELFYRITTASGLKRLDEIANLANYTCQYTGTGFEDYCRRLFISRYETRATEVSFKYLSEDANTLKVMVSKSNKMLSLPKDAVVYSLRTYAGVKHMDVTGEEEYAIIDAQAINKNYLTLAGFADTSLLYKASNDIKTAYNEIAGKVLLVRRARLTSSNLFWFAFYSSHELIGPSSPMICLKLKDERDDYYKAITLYLNSSLAFIQLLAYLAVTEGGWVTLHSDQTWSNIVVPDLKSLPDEILKEAVQTFNDIAKVENGLQSLYSRYVSGSDIQKKIDKMALKMVGLTWSDKDLDEIYRVIKLELDVMQNILEESTLAKKKTDKTKDIEHGKNSNTLQTNLSKWINE
jgi:hypothetical protein